jgi:hypothetical protein
MSKYFEGRSLVEVKHFESVDDGVVQANLAESIKNFPESMLLRTLSDALSPEILVMFDLALNQRGVTFNEFALFEEDNPDLIEEMVGVISKLSLDDQEKIKNIVEQF